MVSCQVEGRRMQCLRCGNLWRNIGKTERTACGICQEPIWSHDKFAFYYLDSTEDKISFIYVLFVLDLLRNQE